MVAHQADAGCLRKSLNSIEPDFHFGKLGIFANVASGYPHPAFSLVLGGLPLGKVIERTVNLRRSEH